MLSPYILGSTIPIRTKNNNVIKNTIYMYYDYVLFCDDWWLKGHFVIFLTSMNGLPNFWWGSENKPESDILYLYVFSKFSFLQLYH